MVGLVCNGCVLANDHSRHFRVAVPSSSNLRADFGQDPSFEVLFFLDDF